MIGTPVDIIPVIRGVQLVLIGYNGYTKGSRYETDRMVRDEIIRAAGRVRSHMQNVFDNEFKNGNMQTARSAKQCMEECDYLMEDVKKAVAGIIYAPKKNRLFFSYGTNNAYEIKNNNKLDVLYNTEIYCLTLTPNHYKNILYFSLHPW